MFNLQFFFIQQQMDFAVIFGSSDQTANPLLNAQLHEWQIDFLKRVQAELAFSFKHWILRWKWQIDNDHLGQSFSWQIKPFPKMIRTQYLEFAFLEIFDDCR